MEIKIQIRRDAAAERIERSIRAHNSSNFPACIAQ